MACWKGFFLRFFLSSPTIPGITELEVGPSEETMGR